MKQQTGSRWRQPLVSFAATAVLAASGCTSLEVVPVPVGQPPGRLPAVHAGEQVQVTRHDGRKEAFCVTAVEPDALVGKDVSVPYSDIAVLKVRRADEGHTALIVSTVAGVVLALVVTEAIFDNADKFGTVAGSP